MAKWLAYLLMGISLVVWLILSVIIFSFTLANIINPLYNEPWLVYISGLLEFAATAYGWGYLRNLIADKARIRTIRPWLVMIVLTGISIPVIIILIGFLLLLISGGG